MRSSLLKINAPLRHIHGFTLIEMAIVLVIIGLIVGGILVGRDLMSASRARSQLNQIEKIKSAINTFRVKYGYLPGDIPNPYAINFGFVARGNYEGEGDGNGAINGVYSDAPASNCSGCNNAGETLMFWVDLAAAKLIPGSFDLGSPTVTLGIAGNYNLTQFARLWPRAVISERNFILVASGVPTAWNGFNYISVNVVASLSNSGGGTGLVSGKGMTVAQAYSIETKIDDGYPQLGNVLAMFPSSNGIAWANNLWGSDTGNFLPEPMDATTCYDNNNVTSARRLYSITYDGSRLNCALSFKID